MNNLIQKSAKRIVLLSIIVASSFSSFSQTSIWGTPTPALIEGNDGYPFTAGLKFRSSQTAYIEGIRFYKWDTDTNTYVLRLYKNRDSTLLATTTYRNPSATGWVQSLFSSPVAIEADTLYMVSVHSPSGNYSATDSYFSNGHSFINGRFTAPASNPTDGYNGLYVYGNYVPNTHYEDANYWVDIVAHDPNLDDVNWQKSGNNVHNTNSGIVSIGTSTNPAPGDANLKLAVNGNIYTKKLRVTQTGWADFVFDSSYQLPALDKVEQYIKQHHRLPDMPSEKEVRESGVDVGDQQVLLLQKIEELTLYIIELRKEMDVLKKKARK